MSDLCPQTSACLFKLWSNKEQLSGELKGRSGFYPSSCYDLCAAEFDYYDDTASLAKRQNGSL